MHGFGSLKLPRRKLSSRTICTQPELYLWTKLLLTRQNNLTSVQMHLISKNNNVAAKPFLLRLQVELSQCWLKVFSNKHRRKGKVQLLFVILGHSFTREWRLEN